MSVFAKRNLIFPLACLSVMLFAAPVHAVENDQQLQEIQAPELEQIQVEQQPAVQQEEITVIYTEEGKYTLYLSSNTNMRSEPSINGKIIITLPFGIDLGSDRKVVNSNGETWYEVTYSGISGYVSAAVVTAKVDLEAIEDTPAEPEEPGVDETVTEPEPQDTGTADDTDDAIYVPQPAEQSETGVETASSGSDISDPAITQNSSDADVTDAPAGRKFDHISVIFLMLIIFALVITILVFVRLRAEYARYRKRILKNRKDEALQD